MSPRRTEAVARDGHLRPLADDVATKPDPRAPGELEPETRRFGDGRRKSVCQPRRLEGHEERLGATSQRGKATKALGDTGGGRAGVRTRWQVDDEQIHRASREKHAGDGQALVEGLRGQDHEPVQPHAAGDGLDRIKRPGEVEPGHDRAVRLGLGCEPESQRGLAGACIATERDAGAAGQTAWPEDRIESGKPGPDDPAEVRGGE